MDALEQIQKKADDAGLDIVVYISMAFGNPYGDPWSIEEVVSAVDVLESSGIKMISLADTVGLASADEVRELVSAVMEKYSYLEIGAHLHSRPELAEQKILAAYDAGCRRFDSAIGGLGGCPFAQDELVGNIATEVLIQSLQSRGVVVPVKKSLDKVLAVSSDIAAEYSVKM